MRNLWLFDKKKISAKIFEEMRDTITYRGSDDAGMWQGKQGDFHAGMARRRLSIIDLSESGHQPMTSSDGRYIIVYNGEVY